MFSHCLVLLTLVAPALRGPKKCSCCAKDLSRISGGRAVQSGKADSLMAHVGCESSSASRLAEARMSARSSGWYQEGNMMPPLRLAALTLWAAGMPVVPPEPPVEAAAILPMAPKSPWARPSRASSESTEVIIFAVIDAKPSTKSSILSVTMPASATDASTCRRALRAAGVLTAWDEDEASSVSRRLADSSMAANSSAVGGGGGGGAGTPGGAGAGGGLDNW
mmetsp:Transcript_136136/g.435442  ORF Transcript_136136/g.435442 Transcript_136136/m.435442 type:complete len:222 (-) Transcript_136136:2252-2917(-)